MEISDKYLDALMHEVKSFIVPLTQSSCWSVGRLSHLIIPRKRPPIHSTSHGLRTSKSMFSIILVTSASSLANGVAAAMAKRKENENFIFKISQKIYSSPC